MTGALVGVVIKTSVGVTVGVRAVSVCVLIKRKTCFIKLKLKSYNKTLDLHIKWITERINKIVYYLEWQLKHLFIGTMFIFENHQILTNYRWICFPLFWILTFLLSYNNRLRFQVNISFFIGTIVLSNKKSN